MRLWVRTWSVRLVVDPRLDLLRREAIVFAFWHGQQLGLLSQRRRPTVTLVSWSRDGELQTGAMRALGLDVVRGSASRAGASGLRAMIRALRAGRDAAFAVDGSRGPLHRVKPGAARAAARAGALLVPLAVAARRRLVLARAWDRFEIPLPFTRVVVVAGAALEPARVAEAPKELGKAIEAARHRAEKLLVAPAGVADLVWTDGEG